MVRFKVGAKVYLRNDLGDYFNKRSVVVPRNTVGKFKGYYDRADPSGPTKMARIDVPTSPGQPSLECRREEVEVFWSLTPIPDAPIPEPTYHTAWNKLMAPDPF
jgi:hypothetical protein